jgi:hypothetical protein
MDFWRRATERSRQEKMRNEDIRTQMEVTTTIINKIKKKQLKCYGHVQRMGENRIPKMVMEWSPSERRKRGRPAIIWISRIRKAISERNLRE